MSVDSITVQWLPHTAKLISLMIIVYFLYKQHAHFICIRVLRYSSKITNLNIQYTHYGETVYPSELWDII